MTNTWTAIIEVSTEERVTEEQASAMIDRFSDHGAAGAFQDHHAELTLSLGATGHAQAFTEVQELLPALREVLGAFEVTALNLMSPATFFRAGEDEAIVGLKEIADLLEVSRQRANQIVANKSFPAPMANLASGRLWSLDAVEAWKLSWDRKSGRPAV